jgi:hypothetical protein
VQQLSRIQGALASVFMRNTSELPVSCQPSQIATACFDNWSKKGTGHSESGWDMCKVASPGACSMPLQLCVRYALCRFEFGTEYTEFKKPPEEVGPACLWQHQSGTPLPQSSLPR